MRIFVYEFVTGGGWYAHTAGPPSASLLAEGRAMVRALAADLAAIGDLSVDIMCDARWGDVGLPGCTVHRVASADDEQQAIRRLSAAADWTVLIAPEFCGYLHSRVRAVEDAGGRLLGPGFPLIALTSDKHATAEHLASHNVKVPLGVSLDPHQPWPADFDYPAVLKPRDGAGSLGIQSFAQRPSAQPDRSEPARLEVFCPGTAASVACLCGPQKIVPLEPCRQFLGGESGFSYLGGSLPIPGPLARRARKLAVQALDTLSGPLGYLGVDLVLGQDPAGFDDVVIEINPRLTTSYVGLRALLDGNLAASMLTIAAGESPELRWKPGRVEFNAAGDARHCVGR